MKAILTASIIALSACTSILPAQARDMISTAVTSADGPGAGGTIDNKPGYLECVPFARDRTGINLHGDAWTWWNKAAGRYARGHTPKVGAVMALEPFHNSKLGHVAAVTRIIDSRTILVSHSNWSPINGERGQIERNVTVLDVSPTNNWSEVRVWYAPSNNLGAAHWPVTGFIYPEKPGNTDAADQRVAAINTAHSPSSTVSRTGRRHGKDAIGEILAGNY